jgi:hypothetical protein
MRARHLVIAFTLVSLVACDTGPVAWEETRTLGASTASGEALQLERGDVSVARAELPTSSSPVNACPNSVVYAKLAGDEWHRAWWSAASNGRVRLLASRSGDAGTTWSDPVVVDTSDVSGLGCRRPAPAIAADSITRYVHLVYYLVPKTGAGVWYAHSMDGGITWHSNYGLIYGDDPARADVAADGERVGIVYELPNAAERRVGLTLSRDGGHSFLPPVIVSSSSGEAAAPRVAVRRNQVAVAWTGRGGEVIAQVGVLRP